MHYHGYTSVVGYICDNIVPTQYFEIDKKVGATGAPLPARMVKMSWSSSKKKVMKGNTISDGQRCSPC